MLFYYILITLLLPYSLNRSKRLSTKLHIILKLLPLYCLAAFRSLEIGNDTSVYYNLFTVISNSDSSDISSLSYRYEIGYLWLNRLISYVTPNFWVFLSIITLIVYYSYYKLILSYSTDPGISVFLFFILGFWGHTVNILRVQLSLSMTILAFLALRNGKIGRAVLFIALAILFHRVAIIYALSFLVPPRINKKIYAFMLGTCLVVLLFLPQIISIVASIIPYFRVYLSNAYNTLEGVKLASVVGVLIRFVFFVVTLCIFRVHKGKLSNEEQKTFIYQINMIFISLLVMIVSLRFSLLERCQYFNWVFIITLIPSVLTLLKIKNRVIVRLAILLFCISQFLVTNIYRPEWNHIYPYKTILSEQYNLELKKN